MAPMIPPRGIGRKADSGAATARFGYTWLRWIPAIASAPFPTVSRAPPAAPASRPTGSASSPTATTSPSSNSTAPAAAAAPSGSCSASDEPGGPAVLDVAGDPPGVPVGHHRPPTSLAHARAPRRLARRPARRSTGGWPVTPAFAHASEAEMARILDFYAVRWEYEPDTFPILWNLDGDVVESFSPDFYLPDLDLYLEMTTLRQKLVRKKNRKLRRLRELYPSVNDQAVLRPRLPRADAQVRPARPGRRPVGHVRPGRRAARRPPPKPTRRSPTSARVAEPRPAAAPPVGSRPGPTDHQPRRARRDPRSHR